MSAIDPSYCQLFLKQLHKVLFNSISVVHEQHYEGKGYEFNLDYDRNFAKKNNNISCRSTLVPAETNDTV